MQTKRQRQTETDGQTKETGTETDRQGDRDRRRQTDRKTAVIRSIGTREVQEPGLSGRVTMYVSGRTNQSGLCTSYQINAVEGILPLELT